MNNNIPYDLPPDDDTEEMEPREYKPIPPRPEDEFPVSISSVQADCV